MTIKELANHLAEIPSWITGTMDAGEWDVAGYKPPNEETVDALVKIPKYLKKIPLRPKRL